MDFSEEPTDSCSEVGLAVRIGNVEELKLLISEGRHLDLADNRGWCPLHEASVLCSAEHLKCMKLLLKCGNSDINRKTQKGETALFLACKLGEEYHTLEAVQMLLSAGANVNIPDNNDATPLLTAARLVRMDIVHELLNTRVADTNLGDFGGWRPLHHAAKNGQKDMVVALLASGAQLDVETRHGMTPLDIAAAFGSLECLRLLLEIAKERCQLHLVNSPHRTMPLFTVECVELLLSYRSNIGLEDALKMAIKQKQHKTLKLLLQVMDIEALKSKLWLLPGDVQMDTFNPLHMAVEFQSHWCLRILLEAGFPVDSIYWRDIFRQDRSMMDLPTFETPLSLSLWKNDIEAAKILLSAGANSNAGGKQVFPPLFSAILNGTSKEIDLAIDHGAEFGSYEVLAVALAVPENLFHILRRGADPSSCFGSNLSSFAVSLLQFKSQDKILLVLQMLIAFLDHKPQASNFLMMVAEQCLELFQTEYNDQSWSRLINSVHYPSSLFSLCRSSVRRHLLRLDRISLEARINSLQIPQSVISFLNYEVSLP